MEPGVRGHSPDGRRGTDAAHSRAFASGFVLASQWGWLASRNACSEAVTSVSTSRSALTTSTVFIGPITKAVFYRVAPDGHYCDGKVNVFDGNDFSEAEIGDVGFRGGVDLASQRWPDGLDPTEFTNA